MDNHLKNDLDNYITGHHGEDQLAGICKWCGEPIYEEQGYEVCLTCNGLFHVDGCLEGRYVEARGFWCQACVDDDKHLEVCPQCGLEVKDFTELDDHNMCWSCLQAWKQGELPWQIEDREETSGDDD